LGFEARFVVDWTERVWSEFWSEEQTRWIHVDAAENLFDDPLAYESLWAKKFTYILAFSSKKSRAGI
jgi:peptide-N4-(N-acetyl-beta-glucosaminyl)asparagine amidase